MRKLLDRGISNALYMQIVYTEGEIFTIEEWFQRRNGMEFSVTFVDKDGFYNHKLVVANNVDEVQKYMEDLGYTDIKIEKR